MLTKTKSRMKEHYGCFYTFNDENLFINSSETKGIYPNIIEIPAINSNVSCPVGESVV